MAAVIGALRAELSASIAKFQQDMGKAAASVRQFAGISEAQGRRIQAVGSKITAFGKGLAAAFGAGSIAAIGRGVIRMASDLQDAADQLNLTTQELQGLQAVALNTGASTSAVNRALSFLTARLGEAEGGTGDLAKAMRKYGVDMGTPMQVLLDFADRVKNAKTWTEKMAISTALFARSGKTMVPMLNEGADGIARMLEQAQKDGQIWDPAVIQKLDDAADAFERLKTSLAGKLAEPFSDFLTHLDHLVKSPSWKEFWFRTVGPMGIDALGVTSSSGVALPTRGRFGNDVGAGLGAIDVAREGVRSDFFSGTGSGPAPTTPRGAVPNAPGSGAAAARAAEAAAQKRLAWLAQTQKEAADDFEKAVEELRDAYVGQASSLERQLSTAQQIGDLQRSLGFGAPISAGQEATQGKQRELDTQRAASLTKIRELENEIIKATLAGKTEHVAALNEELTLQQQLDALLGTTSAEQIMAAQRINDAFKSLTDNLSSSLSTMLMEWQFDVESLKSVFKQFISDLLIKPAIEEATGLLVGLFKDALGFGVGGTAPKGTALDPIYTRSLDAVAGGAGEVGKSLFDALGSLFEGGFAGGGFVRPQHWGIAGENGPEPVFGGRLGASVVSGGGERSGGGNTYVDMRGADVAAVARLERFVRSQARGERDRWKIHFASNVGSMPR